LSSYYWTQAIQPF